MHILAGADPGSKQKSDRCFTFTEVGAGGRGWAWFGVAVILYAIKLNSNTFSLIDDVYILQRLPVLTLDLYG